MDAEDYARNRRRRPEWALELIRKARSEGNERGMDVGCGDGKITAAIADALDFELRSGHRQSAEMVC